MDLGRYQLGQPVVLSIATVDGGGNPAAPDSAPIAVVTNSASVVVESVKLAMNGGSTSFKLPIFLDLGFSLGTYTVTYSYSASAFGGSGSDTFEVVPGGDPGGKIISMSAYDRPEARYVVAQLASGILVQGRNPRLNG